MIILTDKAIKKIKEIADSEGLITSIRVKCLGSGCSGVVRDIHFEEQIMELDELSDQDGIKIIIDPFSSALLDETIVEYVEEEFGGGFRFSSHNVKSSCGCGKSVGY
jgi:iron-sulfur cluster assembly protein